MDMDQATEMEQIQTNDIEQIQIMLEGANKALKIIINMRNLVEQKRHLRAVFVTLCKIRLALYEHLQE